MFISVLSNGKVGGIPWTSLEVGAAHTQVHTSLFNSPGWNTTHGQTKTKYNKYFQSVISEGQLQRTY